MSPRHRTLAALVISAALLLPACGASGDGDDAASESMPATSATTATASTAAPEEGTSRTSAPSGPTTTRTPASATMPDGPSERTIDVDGLERTFRLYRPAGLDGPAPLVVMMHGGFGSAAQAERSYGWDAMADSGRFIVAYPDGLGRAWNAGGDCCGRPAREDTDDVGFISEVVGSLVGSGDVDPQRVYATGMSNGAIMSYRLACETDLFAAVAPVAGTQLVDCANPSPTSVLHIHGLADDRVRLDGGQGAGVARIDGPPVPEVIAGWRRVDRCAAPKQSDSGPLHTSTASCADGRTVELITIGGAGHQWPGSEPIREEADPPSAVLEATRTIWEFFATQHR